MDTYERYRVALRDAPRPLAFVDLELFDQNAEALVRRADGLPIRVASKSVRCLALIQRLLKRPGYAGVLAYSPNEAVHLVRNGVDDVVVAYPTVSEAAVREVADEIRKGRKIVLMTDRTEHLDLLQRVGQEEKVTFPIAIDLDMSSRWLGIYFGVRRSWISNSSRLGAYLEALRKAPNLKLEGAMGYEAQIAGVSDRSFLMRFLKRRSVKNVRRIRAEYIRQIQAAGHSLRFVNGGGTGSLESTRRDSSVTELAAGSGLFSPALFDDYAAFRHEPAAGFALDVVRKPEENIATCFSGGYVASGALGKEKLPSPYLPAGLSLLPHEGAGEVQTPVSGNTAIRLKVGDLVIFRHAKAGELCERFNELHLIWNAQVTGRVPTYRGEGKNFG